MCSGDKKDDHCEKPEDKSNKPLGSSKDKVAHKMQQTTSAAGQNAKQLLGKVSGFIENSSAIKQIALGAAGGWVSGFVTHRVGRTAGLTIGGSILIIAAAEQTGIININWEKFGKKVQKLSGKAESIGHQHGPNLHYAKKYARTNTYFAAGFLGGFLIGVCS